VFKRAAEIGDGFIFGSGQKENLEAMNLLQAHLETNGRNIDEFGVEALLNYQSGPDKWAEEVRAWRDIGAEYVSMRAMALRGQGEGLKSPQEHIDILSTYWDVVGELSD
jgi:alkanesulfonate monooxygenase SsuD/methylene tetrahydromethanopterin reductase-like flavin-dependent oxidoreductase (luciferase family)